MVNSVVDIGSELQKNTTRIQPPVVFFSDQ